MLQNGCGRHLNLLGHKAEHELFVRSARIRKNLRQQGTRRGETSAFVRVSSLLGQQLAVDRRDSAHGVAVATVETALQARRQREAERVEAAPNVPTRVLSRVRAALAGVTS